MNRFLFFCFSLCLSLLVSAQVSLTKNGKAVSRLVLVEDNPVNQQAAKLLQQFVKQMSGAQLPILTEQTTGKGNVYIGGRTNDAGEDGFHLLTNNGSLFIQSGGDKGAIYGVVTLLEDYLGVHYWAAECFDCPKNASITVPNLNRVETPAFRYRQTYSYGNDDPIYKMWYRLEEPNEMFIDDMWVHTFNRILPSKQFGKEHPEWYSFINGERRPGDHSQWCLTNPAVFDACVHQLDSIFAAHPDLKMISVSQNDGNNTQCSCEECRKLEEYEGSPSGVFIHFLNKLASHYPDKEFSTLAYLFTMQPPKHVKPLPNVNIMLCDIDCKREVPLTDNASGQYFMQALEGWSKISDNIFVWDYGINFDNIVSPFPNFHILQKNMQTFKDHHATMHFAQVNGIKGGDFSEMRAYILSKLMWNPYQDVDELMNTFMVGYYGAAAPYLYQYQKIMEGALLASGKELWIYDSPITHKDGMLNAHLRKVYNELFDKAEAAVKDDAEKLYHVQLSRLTLQYSELEIARTEQGGDKDKVKADLDLFQQRTRKFGVKSLNERNNAPEDYCELYRKRFIPQDKKSLAAGAKVAFLSKPDKKYQPIADSALTDELYGGTTYVESWVGWEGRDASFVIDLGEQKTFNTIETDFLHQLGAWILLPKGGRYSISEDGEHFQEFGVFSFPEDRDVQVKFVPGRVQSETPINARYIKVDIQTLGMCPDWHYGVGYPAWFFLDEVSVY